MDFFEILQRRRSIREFLDKEVEKDKIKKLIQAGFLAPSDHNIRPWHFVVVTDKKLIKKLSFAKSAEQSLCSAPLVIVIAVNSDLTKFWIENAATAAQNIYLAATSMNLGACWIQIRKKLGYKEQIAEAYVREVLAIPKKFRITCMMAIGYPKEFKPPHKLLIEYNKVSLNRFGNKIDFD